MTETRACQNCKKDFTIEPEDFEFYERIKVPAPTFCPECRRARRLAWMNVMNLYKRECDLCHKQFVSMYAPETPYIVYCPKCWWGDGWDWRVFGKEYDPEKYFFTQFAELLKTTPLCGLSINTSTTEGSPYNNHAQDLKNCYLTFLTSYNQDCAYGILVTRNTEAYDCSMVMDCDSCYDCMNIFKSNRCVGTRGNARFSMDCWFNRDCDNCTDCIGCTNLRNQQYCIFNTQYDKEAYKLEKQKYDIGSFENYERLKNEAEAFWRTQPPKPAYDDHSVDHTGSYIFNSKNCKECYDVTGAENGKYLMMLYNDPIKDCYDVTSWGGNLSLSYEGNNIGEQAANMRFAQESGISSMDVEYGKLVFGSSHVFGGVSVRKGSYVILNKEYAPEEYAKLREQIITDMQKKPFMDKNGEAYAYGEFFPFSISPFAYNKTLAQFFSPVTEAEAAVRGLAWESEQEKSHAITKSWQDIPDHISAVADEIVHEVIACRTCDNGYKIIPSELQFLKKMNLPIPRECPFCRINAKFSLWVENMQLHERVCADCGIKFHTHYTEARAPIVVCKACYQKRYI